jgi:Tfp pilus assembly protein PilX
MSNTLTDNQATRPSHTFQEKLDRMLKKHELLQKPKQNALLRKAEALNQRRLASYRKCYSLLMNAADSAAEDAELALTADEFDMLRLAGLTRKQVRSFNAHLSNMVKGAEAAAKAIIGPKKQDWERSKYDPTDPQADIPF